MGSRSCEKERTYKRRNYPIKEVFLFMEDKHFYTIMGVLIVLTLIDIFVKVRVTVTQPVIVRSCVGVTMEEINHGIQSGGLKIIQ